MKVAVSLFSQCGFAGTTTREIARCAGVNPALVFYYFGNKEGLYYTVFDEIWKASSWHERRRNIHQKGASDVVLVRRLAQDILIQLRDNDVSLRLGLFAGLQDSTESRRLSERFFRTYLAETYELLAAYIRDRIRQGVFRKVPPLIAARAFIGIVAYQHIIQEFLGGKFVEEFSPHEMGRVLADIWLCGMRAHPTKSRPPAST